MTPQEFLMRDLNLTLEELKGTTFNAQLVCDMMGSYYESKSKNEFGQPMFHPINDLHTEYLTIEQIADKYPQMPKEQLDEISRKAKLSTNELPVKMDVLKNNEMVASYNPETKDWTTKYPNLLNATKE